MLFKCIGVFIVKKGRVVGIGMDNKMMVIAERNRIANEIHDNVTQRLFGIVYALYSLQGTNSEMTTEQLNGELQLLSQSVSTTLKELRATIYNLSSLKNGELLFVRLQTYLDEYARLCSIRIERQMMGDESSIPYEVKQALYRIMCEACGNAVRHGRCSVIGIQLSITDEGITLNIQDNGIGIDLQKSSQQNGIGLVNMRNLIDDFAGSFSIAGAPGIGTEIQIEISTTKITRKAMVIG